MSFFKDVYPADVIAASIQNLRSAKYHLKRFGWIQEKSTNDQGSACLVGSIQFSGGYVHIDVVLCSCKLVADANDLKYDLRYPDKIFDAVPGNPGAACVQFNDKRGRTVEEVLAALDKAIVYGTHLLEASTLPPVSQPSPRPTEVVEEEELVLA